jgi:hypothetical protein
MECKRRKAGFKTMYAWMTGNHALLVRDDQCEALVVMRLRDFVLIAK